VDRLNRLGRDLLRRKGQFRTGQAVLEEALAFYREMLPEEGNDPRVLREAAQLFGQVAWIHQTLGQAAKAAEAWGRQASLVTTLLEKEPASRALRLELADVHRWRGNMLRDLGEAREARQAYDKAVVIHEGLLREFPGQAGYQVALANTLLNSAVLRARREQAEELEPIYRRILELERAAVRAAPDEPRFRSELALALGSQGLYLLESGRGPRAEAVLREALGIQQRLRAGGHLKGAVEHYMARNLVNLARVLAAAGRAGEAEESYRSAVRVLERLVEQFPESAYRRADLASSLAGLAELLDAPGRRREAEEVRRRVIRQYERLKADFPENPDHRRNLVLGYLQLVALLCQLGRQSEAAVPYGKALEQDPGDPAVNNELAWFLATSPEPRLRDAALAVRLAKKAVTARPRSADYRNTLGVAHYRNGDDKAAVAELETAMGLRAGGDCFDWFFLAMAHRRLGDRAGARTWFDRAVRWMDAHKPHPDELRRFRAEADALLADAGKR
jgi:tetratricopeptide (TPR) repeat protein